MTERVVFGQPPLSRRQRGGLALLVGLALAAVLWRALRGDVLGAVLSVLLHGGMTAALVLSTTVTVVLEADALVVRRPWRTRRIAYRDIADVRGTVPGRPTWGTGVRLHLRDGSAVVLPEVLGPPRELREALLPRLTGPSDRPSTGRA